ncbi:MAG: glutamine amidotransferase-related protein, partial [Candidatus Hodgkinia cicadicola]
MFSACFKENEITFAIDQSKPVLGICVGMQLMATLSLELRKTPGLNWIPGLVT